MRLTLPDVGFAGAPIETDLDRLSADVAIVGVPFGWPYPRPGPSVGCAMAPAAVRRRADRLARFRDHWDFDLGGPMLPVGGPRMTDVGDVPGDATDGAGNSALTEAAIRRILEAGALPIAVGGDDSVVIPVLRAYAGRGPLTILHIDAHLDFRDEVSGVREGYSSPMRRASEMEHVMHIVQVGLRGVGSARAAEVDDAREAGNALVTARELRERGVASVLAMIPADAAVFVAFDTDGLDPSICPAVSAPAPGGLSWDEASDLLGGIGGRLVGAVFTELVPALDVNDLSALVVARLITRVLGGAASE
jgi:agmatinase